MAINISNAAASAQLDTLTASLNTGYIRIYSGSQPANVDTALGAQVLLAELRFGATAFPAASNGVAAANAITSDAGADATGTASFCRLFQSNGTTAVLDGDVSTTGAFLNLATTSLVIGAPVDITSMTLTQPKA